MLPSAGTPNRLVGEVNYRDNLLDTLIRAIIQCEWLIDSNYPGTLCPGGDEDHTHAMINLWDRSASGLIYRMSAN